MGFSSKCLRNQIYEAGTSTGMESSVRGQDMLDNGNRKDLPVHFTPCSRIRAYSGYLARISAAEILALG